MTPADELQAVLDRLGRATLEGDWATFRAGVELPFSIVTGTARLLVEDEPQLRAGFDEFRGMLAGLQVTDYVRLVQEAAEQGPGVIEGRYVSHLMAGARRAVPPFASAMTLRRVGADWVCIRLRSGILNASWPIAIPTPPNPRPEDAP